MVRFILAAALLFSFTTGTVLGADEVSKKDRTVELTIDFGDGFQKRYTAIKANAKLTVLGVLQAAQRHPRGVKIVARGKGETAFVTQIDDLKNEGRGKNWLFRVNGKLGQRSCDAVPVKAGDKVEWRFAKYDPSE